MDSVRPGSRAMYGRKLSRGILSFSLVLLTALPVLAEFDYEAYRDHLARTRYLTADELIGSYESFGLYEGVVPHRDEAPHYFRAIDQKLRLTAGELELLQRHEFVVSQRWTKPTYGDAFEWVWHADLPVYVSTDAILHAIHKSYDDLLMMAEIEYLLPQVELALTELHFAWQPLRDRYVDDLAMQRSLADVDVYLTVARRLLQPSNRIPSQSGRDDEVEQILRLIQAERPARIALFNEGGREYDFSQFHPRGHYANENGENERLEHYFRAMMWLGRTEFRLTNSDDADATREIVDSFLLLELAQTSGAMEELHDIDRILRSLIGAPDNLTLLELEHLGDALGPEFLPSLFQPEGRSAFDRELAGGRYPGQLILSQILTFDVRNPDEARVPHAFLLIGQRFLLDSFVTGQVVYPFTPCPTPHERPCRTMPDPLDVLFAVGNDDVLPFLREEIEAEDYAPNLSALRYLIDGVDLETWQGSLYNSWLQAIRTLSLSGREKRAPEFMRTGAWQQQKMNTQLAAWAELRHDNLLYGKPSYTGEYPVCSFPYTYVEPLPEFFETLEQFAGRAADDFSAVPGMPREIRGFFENMREILDQLGGIAEKELSGAPFTSTEERFLRSVVYDTRFSEGGCSGGSYYETGWYPELFFTSYFSSARPGERGTAGEQDALVADIHTDPNHSEVLHIATGDPELGIFVAATPGCGRIAYVGPVASYHQFVTANFQRLSDEEWNESYRASAPSRPDWSHVYLADNRGRIRRDSPALVEEPLLDAPWTWSYPDDSDSPTDTTDTPLDDDDVPPDSTETPPADPDTPPDSTGTPDDPGVPPDSVDTSPDPDAAETDPIKSGTAYLSVSPSPVREGALLTFRLAERRADPVRILIYDSQGSLVRELLSESSPNLVHVRWDGATESGRRAGAGVYYVCLKSGRETATQKMVVVH